MNIQLTNVKRSFDDQIAVNDITMSINQGLNFIVGASGSGKTTLLKIISGLDQEFSGDMTIGNRELRKLSIEEKSNFYNQVIGFVWQNSNLIDHLSVLENVQIAQQMTGKPNPKQALKILADLKISGLKDKHVNELSGGQKQRVAIARELCKNPEIIIADEPTSALDSNSSKKTMQILRELAKTKTVIVVTHDLSLCEKQDTVFELDKGVLVKQPETSKSSKLTELTTKKTNFKLANAFNIGNLNTKRRLSKSIALIFTIILSASLSVVSLGGMLVNTSENAYQTLLEEYGSKILDIGIPSAVVAATGVEGAEADKGYSQSNVDIYEKYKNDPRVMYAFVGKSLVKSKFTLNGQTKEIPEPNFIPQMEGDIIAGKFATKTDEAVVSDKMLKQFNLSPEEAIGKKFKVSGIGFNYDTEKTTGEPTEVKMDVEYTISGVVETTEAMAGAWFMTPESSLEYAKKTGSKEKRIGYLTIRAKTPEDTLAIKNELVQAGVNLDGDFSKLEDIERVSGQSSMLSKIMSYVLLVLVTIVLIAVSITTANARKREFAIFKLSGYTNKHQAMILLIESINNLVIVTIVYFILSPLLSIFTQLFFKTTLINSTLYLIAFATIVIALVFNLLITISNLNKLDIIKTLQGENH